MFATSPAQALPASPGHGKNMLGAKRSRGVTTLTASSPVARGCAAATASCGSLGAAATVSTPVHFPKCAKTQTDVTSTGVKYHHSRSKSMDMFHTGNTKLNTRNAGVQCPCGDSRANCEGGRSSPESPLRSRRALPMLGSLSVGAANDDMLQGRPGIVYIDGTKMPRDGWYQRVRALRQTFVAHHGVDGGYFLSRKSARAWATNRPRVRASSVHKNCQSGQKYGFFFTSKNYKINKRFQVFPSLILPSFLTKLASFFSDSLPRLLFLASCSVSGAACGRRRVWSWASLRCSGVDAVHGNFAAEQGR